MERHLGLRNRKLQSQTANVVTNAGAAACLSGGGGETSEAPPGFPGTAEHEIRRIKSAPNHYDVLHVSPDASNSQLQKNYYTLVRILHPDKCQLPGAKDAMINVSLAYDALTNVTKRTLYDQYLTQQAEGGNGKEQTYAEWEASQQPNELPKWLSVLLGIKGCGWILVVTIVLVMLPLIIVVVVVIALGWIILLPYRLILRFCFPEKYKQMKKKQEKDLARMDEERQDRYFAHV